MNKIKQNLIKLKSKHIALISVIITLAILTVLFRYFYLKIKAYPDTPLSQSAETVSLTIDKGTTYSGILKLLYKKQLIKSPVKFRIYTFLTKGNVSIRAGNYIIKRNFSPKQLLNILLAGPKISYVKVTIPEGKNILEIANIFYEHNLSSKKEFLSLVRDPVFAKTMGIKAQTLEGYLFPETYKFQKGSSLKKIIQIMVKQHNKVWHSLVKKNLSSFRYLKAKFGFNHHKIVIFASLVEKETGVAEERPLIAGVFLNRLSFPNFKSRLLQTDPTIIYGCTVPLIKSEACRDFHGRIRRKHLLDKENPYNTYTHKYLPPGPICNPGKASLNAVFNSTKSKYLYFVAKTPGGRHYFSKTLQEHEKAVDKYIRHKK